MNLVESPGEEATPTVYQVGLRRGNMRSSPERKRMPWKMLFNQRLHRAVKNGLGQKNGPESKLATHCTWMQRAHPESLGVPKRASYPRDPVVPNLRRYDWPSKPT